MLSSEIREMSEGDINKRIGELEEERFRLKFRAGTETLEDPLRLRVVRKDVARLKTVLKEKIIGIDQAHLTDGKPKTKAGGAKTRRVRSRSTATVCSRVDLQGAAPRPGQLQGGATDAPRRAISGPPGAGYRPSWLPPRDFVRASGARAAGL